MRCYITVLSCVWVFARGERLGLYEGDVCKQEKGVIWTCKAMLDCPKAQEDLRKGKTASICDSKGEEPIVCCEPEVTPLVPGSKSKQMCKKYAESVIIRLPDPVVIGEYNVVNTCHDTVEPQFFVGNNAIPREYLHTALIGYKRKNVIEWHCGGSLISDQFVLSAAQCTYPREQVAATWVRLGEYNIQSKTDDDSGLAHPEDYEIMERINHPEYTNTSLYNDIALYKLKTRVEFNEYMRPICLQTEHQFATTYSIATGWGINEFGGRNVRWDYLQKVNVTIIPRKQCTEVYQSAIGPKLNSGILDSSMMCAVNTKDSYGEDTCQGDLGGPLQMSLKEPYCMYSQIGITSFVEGCGGDKPIVYTRVSHFVPWIESVVWP